MKFPHLGLKLRKTCREPNVYREQTDVG